MTTAVTLFPRTAVASRLTDRTDHARTAYAHRLHDADLSHPGLYDLIVATGKLGIEEVADVVTAFLAITRLQGATLSPEGSAGLFGEGEAADTSLSNGLLSPLRSGPSCARLRVGLLY